MAAGSQGFFFLAAPGKSGQNMGMERVLAIDLGGTKIAAGVVGPDGKVLAKETAPTPLGDPRSALDVMERLSRRVLAASGPVRAVGVALPGIVDRGTGVLVSSPSSGWRNVPFAAMIRDALGLSVCAENDVNACALAEARFGSGRGLGSFFWMTVSTGIGGAVIVDGRIAGGPMSGEIGHLVVNRRGAPCGCGNRGCLEAEASGPAWRRRALALLDRADSANRGALGMLPRGTIDAKTIAEGARVGDRICLKVAEDVGLMLSRGLSAVYNILDPDAVFLGGGIAAAFDLLEPVIQRELSNLTLGGRERAFPLRRSSLGYDAALIGAASLALFSDTGKEGRRDHESFPV